MKSIKRSRRIVKKTGKKLLRGWLHKLGKRFTIIKPSLVWRIVPYGRVLPACYVWFDLKDFPGWRFIISHVGGETCVGGSVLDLMKGFGRERLHCSADTLDSFYPILDDIKARGGYMDEEHSTQHLDFLAKERVGIAKNLEKYNEVRELLTHMQEQYGRYFKLRVLPDRLGMLSRGGYLYPIIDVRVIKGADAIKTSEGVTYLQEQMGNINKKYEEANNPFIDHYIYPTGPYGSWES